MGFAPSTPRTRSLTEWETLWVVSLLTFTGSTQTVSEVISARVRPFGPAQSPMDARMNGAVRRVGHFYEKQEKIWIFCVHFGLFFGERILANFRRFRKKHSKVWPHILSNIGPMRTRLRLRTAPIYLVHAHMKFVPWTHCSFSNTSVTDVYSEKNWVLQKCSKFPHWLIFPRNYFGAEMYLGVSLITFYNNFSAW